MSDLEDTTSTKKRRTFRGNSKLFQFDIFLLLWKKNEVNNL